MSIKIILTGICAGVAATATMDILAIIFNRMGLTAGAKGQWVGRWYLGLLRGKLTHDNITACPEQPGEKQAALVGHYMIGAVLAVFYFAAAHEFTVAPEAFFAAVGYGLVTCVFPWFLVLPALGFGIFGRKGPPELNLFRSTVMNHLFYGLGLWWTARVLPLG